MNKIDILNKVNNLTADISVTFRKTKEGNWLVILRGLEDLIAYRILSKANTNLPFISISKEVISDAKDSIFYVNRLGGWCVDKIWDKCNYNFTDEYYTGRNFPKDEAVFGDGSTEFANIRVFTEKGFTHYYAKILIDEEWIDVVIDNEVKWNTRSTAVEKAKDYLTYNCNRIKTIRKGTDYFAKAVVDGKWIDVVIDNEVKWNTKDMAEAKAKEYLDCTCNKRKENL